MDKLKMQTANKADENFKKLAEMFPNAVTETIDENGEVVRAIDKDVMMQEINTKVVDGKEERYQFTWPDKKKSVLLANAPINKTLRPCREESVDFDTTENLYIEGDNLEVLKLLQETYLGKIKMIYIDPPYNTGSDFVYPDNYRKSIENYKTITGQTDKEGNGISTNTENNGRFHTDWLNMMYPRLRLARNLLADDGVLFISIDDNEVTNLTKICDEIFGEINRIALICNKSRASISNDKIISPNHNIVLFYSKNISKLEANRKSIGLEPLLDGFDSDDNDGKGAYRLVPVDGPGGAKKGNPHYEFLGIQGYWRFSKETMTQKYNEGLVVKKGNGLYQKYYKTTALNSRRTATTWWDDVSLMSTATSKLKDLMEEATFDTPKPIELIDKMLRMITHFDKNCMVLDFFSGSATTAHAVMQLNAEDGGNRRFICVQLPEPTQEDSEAFKAGYKNICEIGKERIKRAGEKIKEEVESGNEQLKIDEEPKKIPDIGFKVFKLDSSNLKKWNPDFENLEVTLDDMISNYVPDRTEEDIVYEFMLKMGLDLSYPIDVTEIDGRKIYSIGFGALMMCLDDNITVSVAEDMVRMYREQAPETWKVVFKDNGFADDCIKTNVKLTLIQAGLEEDAFTTV